MGVTPDISGGNRGLGILTEGGLACLAVRAMRGPRGWGEGTELLQKWGPHGRPHE